MKFRSFALFALSSLLLLWTVGSGAQVVKGSHVGYAVDPTTAVPAATVVQNSNGVTVVLFKVAALTAGETFSFRLDLTSASSKVTYPVTVDLNDHGNGKLDTTFNPAEVSLTAANTVSSSVVTVTVAPSGDGAKKLKTMIKAEAVQGSHLGKGPGVKVVVMQGTTLSANPEQQMLLDVQDALSPDGENGPTAQRPE